MDNYGSGLDSILSEENDKSHEEGTDDEDEYGLERLENQSALSSSSDNDKVSRTNVKPTQDNTTFVINHGRTFAKEMSAHEIQSIKNGILRALHLSFSCDPSTIPPTKVLQKFFAFDGHLSSTLKNIFKLQTEDECYRFMSTFCSQ